jgi:Ca2+-binding EF-hand superfamily protein
MVPPATLLKKLREMKANRASSTVDFESFQKVLNRPGGFRDPGEPEEYCRGFQVFDKDMTGFIGVGQLRYSAFDPVEDSLLRIWELLLT